MPEFKFVSILCQRTDDSSRSDDRSMDMTEEDEPYLLADHKRVWDGRRMNINDVADLSGIDPISFKDSILIELWDRDAGYDPDDDQIGRLNIQAFQSGLGELTHEFKRKNARYTLTYKVE